MKNPEYEAEGMENSHRQNRKKEMVLIISDV